jgi:oligopeptide transport system substrate-binding protein
MYYRLILLFLFALLVGCQNQNSRSLEQIEESRQVVRISIDKDPSSLDPRASRDLPTATLLHMLYEGLMRADYDGNIIPALAREFTLSKDHKTYTFKLRPSRWSNGDPLTAHHFVETWRSLLDPQFPAPNAYQFYMIKGAKEAKLGKIPLAEVAIKALDDETLVVELEEPTPYFLELVAAHFFYPVHPQSKSDALISNGPFKLQQWARQDALTFVKNNQFWDASEVRLQKIVVNVLDEKTALALFENRELSWAGSPMSTLPQDAIDPLKHRRRLHILPAAGTHWCRYNTLKSPFQNKEMRRAFALALDRHAIVTHVTQGNQQPAMAIVPPAMGLPHKAYFEDHDSPRAWQSFQQALEELKLSKDDLPEIVLHYASSDRNQKVAQAIQQQWVKGLGITVRLQSEESQVFLDRLKRGDYQMGLGGWYADVRDPVNFLDLFRSKSNATNQTNWEQPRFIELLAQAANEMDKQKRFDLLDQAQAFLMGEMPVAPLYFGSFNYVKSERLIGVYFSDLGILDFTYAFLEE